MEEIVSLVVANGLWAVLFCGLLVYELKDSRNREANYAKTVKSLTDRLAVVSEIKADTDEIRSDVEDIKSDVRIIKRESDGRGRRKKSDKSDGTGERALPEGAPA